MLGTGTKQALALAILQHVAQNQPQVPPQPQVATPLEELIHKYGVPPELPSRTIRPLPNMPGSIPAIPPGGAPPLGAPNSGSVNQVLGFNR